MRATCFEREQYREHGMQKKLFLPSILELPANERQQKAEVCVKSQVLNSAVFSKHVRMGELRKTVVDFRIEIEDFSQQHEKGTDGLDDLNVDVAIQLSR